MKTDLVRCHRLNKECCPTETLRRRNLRKLVVSKTERFEEKLDGLVSLIKAGGQSSGVAKSVHATAAIDNPKPHGIDQINANIPIHHKTERGSVSSSSSDYIQNLPALKTATTDSTNSSYDLFSSGPLEKDEPSLVEAEECFINFQTYKLRYFPFVYIACTITAQELRQERPFF